MSEVLAHRASRAQHQLWFVEQLAPGEPVHNISFEYRYAGRIEPDALRAALADVVARHESLRTALVVRDGELCQVVSTPPDEPPLAFVDLSGAADPAAAYRALCATVGTAPFDLGVPPLLRLRHVRLGAATDALVVVVHHIVADATSVSIMLRDLAAAYEHRLAGHAPDWPELAVQYADFTAWQEEQADRPGVQADLAYWRQQLTELSTLDLTHGRQRPAQLTQRARRLPLTIDPDLAAALDEFVRAEHATPFAAFLAAYSATLGRVFGGTDMAVASTVAGRPLPEVREVVGMFVDRVVLRLDTSGGPTFRELVRSARQVVADAHDHTGVTFDQVAAAVAPQRVTGLTPLAQAAINLQPPAVARPAAGRMPAIVTGSSIDTGTVADDLWLDLVAEPVPYSGEVRYRPDVVADAAAERVRAVFQLLLRDGIAEPDRPLWTFDVVAPAELADLRGPAATGDDTLLPELIEARATATPAAPAVVWAGGALDYAGLDAAANRMAHALRALGVRPEEPVLVALPRTAELVVAFLGVLKAGGVYVPIDAGAPAGHLAGITEQCAARIAIAAADVALPDTVARVAVDAAPGQDPGRPESAARPANAAYVMFTSGSTGVPKGVVVTHQAVVAFVRGLLTVLPPGASHLLVQPPTFDSSLTPILCALAGGGALHLADETTARDAEALGGFVTAHPVDFLKITPSHLTALLAGSDPAALRPRRAVVLSGEPVGPALVRRLRDAGWGVVVQYGPTETDTVTAGWLDGVDPAGPPLGRPLPGVSAQVLDRWDRPVPPGCAGELHIGGPQVARGYLGAPGATAGRFAPDPDQPGARRYRTGDLVRWQPGGWLEFCGRTDRQVKIRGFRVEPGAVEAVLLTHPGVRACAVVAAGADGDRRLVAYVVGDEHELDDAGLPEFVSALLPAYCVPSAVVVLAALPMTRHGKLDEAALPGGPEARTVRCEPETPLERALLDGWRRLLPRADFGVTDDFFDIGGDSILAIHAVAQARSHGMALTVRQVFDLRSVRAIARTLADSPAAEDRPWLAVTGQTVVHLPVTRSSSPGVVGIEVDDAGVLTADPSLVDDWSVGVVVRRMCTGGPAPDGVPLGVPVPGATLRALAGQAHDAYGTTTIELVAAATVAAVDADAVTLADVRRDDHGELGHHAEPGLAKVGAPADDPELIRAVKGAREAAGQDDPMAPVVRVLALPDNAIVTAIGDAGERLVVTLAGAHIVVTPADRAGIAELVRDRLVALVAHCVAAEPEYSPADFPDSGLDDDGVATLLAALELDAEATP